MQKIILITVIATLLNVAATAQDKKVAVFDPAGNVDNSIKEIVREEISSVVVNASGYTVLERSLINKALEENRFQTGGLVDDSQISEIGKHMGANLVFISSITTLNQNYFFSFKLIDVETARIEKQQTAMTQHGTNDLLQIVTKTAREMFGAPKPVANSSSIAGISYNNVDYCNRQNGETCNPDGIELVYVEGTGNSGIMSIHGFYIGKFEVTQAQWQAIMGVNPSRFHGEDNLNNPVESVSWNDVQEFLERFNRHTGKNYRLPTSKEWEYAACGGNQSKEYKYSGSNYIQTVAWYLENSKMTTQPVGTKDPNELGIYDMSGNVWEWCNDLHKIGKNRHLARGGSYFAREYDCRVATRGAGKTLKRYKNIGFRIVLPVEEYESKNVAENENNKVFVETSDKLITQPEQQTIVTGESNISVYAHDVITLRNGDEIKAKVTEITPSEIKYKRSDNLDGPTITVPKADVFAINYENGTREVINALNSTSDAEHSSDEYYSSRTAGALGIRAGVNFANLSYIYFDWLKSWKGNVKMKPGFQLGLIGELHFRNPKLALQGGVIYTQLGTKLEYRESLLSINVKETAKITFHTIHFPVHIQYRHYINDNTTLLLQGGFYADYCKWANVEYEKTLNGNKVGSGDSETLFNSDNDVTDMGIGLGAAFVFNDMFQVGAGYDAGFKTRNLMVTLTFMFGK